MEMSSEMIEARVDARSGMLDIYKPQGSPDVPSSPATLTAYQLPRTPPMLGVPLISRTPPSPAPNSHHFCAIAASTSVDRLTPSPKQRQRPPLTTARRSKPASLSRRGTVVVPQTDGRVHYSHLFGEQLNMALAEQYWSPSAKPEVEGDYGELDGFRLAETDDPFFTERDSDTEGFMSSASSIRSYSTPNTSIKHAYDSGYSTPRKRASRTQPPSAYQQQGTPNAKRFRPRTPTVPKLSLDLFSPRASADGNSTASQTAPRFSSTSCQSDYFTSIAGNTPPLLSPSSNAYNQGFTSPLSDFCPPTPKDIGSEKKESWFRTRSRSGKASRMRSLLNFSPKVADSRRESWLDLGQGDVQHQVVTTEEQTAGSRSAARKSSREMLMSLSTGLGIVGQFGVIGERGLLPAVEIGEPSGSSSGGSKDTTPKANRHPIRLSPSLLSRSSWHVAPFEPSTPTPASISPRIHDQDQASGSSDGGSATSADTLAPESRKLSFSPMFKKGSATASLKRILTSTIRTIPRPAHSRHQTTPSFGNSREVSEHDPLGIIEMHEQSISAPRFLHQRSHTTPEIVSPHTVRRRSNRVSSESGKVGGSGGRSSPSSSVMIGPSKARRNSPVWFGSPPKRRQLPGSPLGVSSRLRSTDSSTIHPGSGRGSHGTVKAYTPRQSPRAIIQDRWSPDTSSDGSFGPPRAEPSTQAQNGCYSDESSLSSSPASQEYSEESFYSSSREDSAEGAPVDVTVDDVTRAIQARISGELQGLGTLLAVDEPLSGGDSTWEYEQYAESPSTFEAHAGADYVAARPPAPTPYAAPMTYTPATLAADSILWRDRTAQCGFRQILKGNPLGHGIPSSAPALKTSFTQEAAPLIESPGSEPDTWLGTRRQSFPPFEALKALFEGDAPVTSAEAGQTEEPEAVTREMHRRNTLDALEGKAQQQTLRGGMVRSATFGGSNTPLPSQAVSPPKTSVRSQTNRSARIPSRARSKLYGVDWV